MFLTDQNGQKSSGRLGFIIVISASVLAMFAALGLALHSVNITGESPNWGGMAGFLTGLSAFAGVAFGGKVMQKREEVKK